MQIMRLVIIAAVALVLLHTAASAGEPVTLENVVEPEPNQADEPFAEKFSTERAARFLDSAALAWQKNRDCMTCHTNYLYLMARPQ